MSSELRARGRKSESIFMRFVDNKKNDRLEENKEKDNLNLFLPGTGRHI